MAITLARAQAEPIDYHGVTYVPIKLSALRLETAPVFSLYMRQAVGQPFVLYSRAGSPFTEEVREKLRENRIRLLYIREKDRMDYSRYVAQNLEEILADKRMDVREKAGVLYDSAQAVVAEVLDKLVLCVMA